MADRQLTLRNVPREAGSTDWLQVVKLPQAKKGFVLLPRRWVKETAWDLEAAAAAA